MQPFVSHQILKSEDIGRQGRGRGPWPQPGLARRNNQASRRLAASPSGPLALADSLIWYLLEYNGMMGKGLSFLVHPETEKVVNVREFVLRSQ